MKEADIQKQILDYLRIKKCLVFKHRNVGIFKQATNSYIPLPEGERGISDIIGCTKEGRFIAIEVKMPKGKLTEYQKDFIQAVNNHGGIGLVAHSLDEVMPYIQ